MSEPDKFIGISSSYRSVKKRSRRKLLLGLALILIAGILCSWFLIRNLKSADLITIEATFMQYACGDENDDILVTKVADPAYNWLVGKDLDPLVADEPGLRNLKSYFYANRDKAGLHYRVTGHLSLFNVSGCGNRSRQFWIDSIAFKDGSHGISSKNLAAAINQ